MSNFDDIRPFSPEELPEAYDRLLADPQFQAVVKYLFPQVPLAAVSAKMHACPTSVVFQKTFIYDLIEKLMAKVSRGFEMDCSAVDPAQHYTFMSNHRDIVLDAALLDVLLIDHGFADTCQIAIGNNLLKMPWLTDLVRINKAFIVKRGLSPEEKPAACRQLSGYMHHVIHDTDDSIWIAQRAGRAKDANDRTENRVLLMLTSGGEGSPVDRLRSLHIAPLAISFEYDPCDYLKARELQLKRDQPGWRKGPMDDLISMKTGIMGYKGHVHYECAPCLDDWLDTVPADLEGEALLSFIGAHIDHEIHSRYQLYPSNYIALDELRGTKDYTPYYNKEDQAFFDQYIEGQLVKVDLQNADRPFLRDRILTMYANPAINYLNAIAQ